MSEDTKVNASDVIDLVVEHMQDIVNEKEGGATITLDRLLKEYTKNSHIRLQEKLDDYVDQRVRKILNDSGLLKAVNPMD